MERRRGEGSMLVQKRQVGSIAVGTGIGGTEVEGDEFCAWNH